MKFYIASKLENAETVKRVAAVLTAAGHDHTYDWTTHGSVKNESEDRLREVAQAEQDGVLAANMVIVLLPGGRGTHVELGIALGDAPRRIVICAEDESFFGTDDRTCAFYWNPKVIRAVGTIDKWLEVILREARDSIISWRCEG